MNVITIVTIRTIKSIEVCELCSTMEAVYYAVMKDFNRFLWIFFIYDMFTDKKYMKITKELLFHWITSFNAC